MFSIILWALLAITPAIASSINSPETLCFTKYGKQSVNKLPTSHFTTTRNITLHSTATVTVYAATLTPTSTVQSTATSTLPVNTHGQHGTTTAASTSTATTTITSVFTSKTTVTTYKSTTTPTHTIKTSPGFTPIASEAAVIDGGGGKVLSQRSLGRREQGRKRGQFLLPRAGGRHPTEVDCSTVYESRFLSIDTVQRMAAQTTTASATTITHTTTLTTLLDRDTAADGSEVKIVTMTVTTTKLETSTSTAAESTAPASTYVAGCQSDNLLEGVGSNELDTSFAGHYTDVMTFSGLSGDFYAADCCQFCQVIPGCTGFNNVNNEGSCEFYVLNQSNANCYGGTAYWAFSAPSGYSPPGGDTVITGNGPCGQGLYVLS